MTSIKTLVVSLIILCTFTACSNENNQPTPHEAPVYNTQTQSNPDPVSVDLTRVELTGGSAGVGEYSTGYRVGQITKYSVKGMMIKSGEGQMLMGRESTPLVKTYTCGDNSTCRKVINPWYFSTSTDDESILMQFTGEYVWTKYNESMVKLPAFGTPYILTEIGKIDRRNPITPCIALDQSSGSKSNGVRVGRIVKASMKGKLTKSGEVTIQVGNSGNQFKNMSIEGGMFSCVVSVLKSAQKVKIHYSESIIRNPFATDTNYTITKIEPLSDI